MEHMTSETLFIKKLPVYETPYYKTGCQFKSSLLRLKYIFKCGQAGSRTASRKLTRLTTRGLLSVNVAPIHHFNFTKFLVLLLL